MLDLGLLESALLLLCAALLTAFCVLAWWKAVGGRVKELISEWRGLPIFWRIILPVVFGAFCLHGSTKNGNVANVQVLPVVKSNYQSGNGENPSNLVNPVNHVKNNSIASTTVRQNKGRKPTTRTDLYVRSWNTTGVWEESFWFEFENDFVFPFGTNHLKGVELHSWGEIWSTHRKDAVLAELGEKVAIGRGVSRFEWEYIAASETNESKYVYSWYNGLVNRETNSVINGRIELMRSGDILVATNGVERIIPRELSLEHDGFGQDNEWVRANFTNANEILSIGYAQWVNDQVGVDLTNGLYKLTVTVPEKPLEITELNVGDYSVAITNAGEYVFLLEKGVEYHFGINPFCASIEYTFADDLQRTSEHSSQFTNARNSKLQQGTWILAGGVDVSYPSIDSYGTILWFPFLQGWPNIEHLGSEAFPKTFEAMLLDYRGSGANIFYEWNSGDDNIKIETPNAESTLVSVDKMPRWSELFLSVTAKIAGREITSVLNGSYGINRYLGVYCSIVMQKELILREKWMDGSKSAIATFAMEADIATNGYLRVSLEQGADKVATDLALPREFYVFIGDKFQQEISIDGIKASESEGDIVLKCEFVDSEGNVGSSCTKPITVVDPLEVVVPSAPSSGVCVLKNSSVNVSLKTLPEFYSLVNVEWYTAQRRYDKEYDSWVKKLDGSLNSALCMDTPGIFAVKARLICGVQSNETVYVHKEDEPYCAAIKEDLGPCIAGEGNHIGVARSAGLLRLRNTALGHLGLAEYGYMMILPSKNGFSKVKEEKWKCNRFVADIAIEAGFQISHNESSHWFGGTYPPVANDWAKGWRIGEWIHLDTVYPEPGFLAARHNPNGPGHCGIVDYDGWVISARPDGVGRNAEKMLDGTIKYNIPKE